MLVWVGHSCPTLRQCEATVWRGACPVGCRSPERSREGRTLRGVEWAILATLTLHAAKTSGISRLRD